MRASRPAFTLLEIIVAIAIIGILTGLAAISYQGVQARGRDAQRANDLSQLKIALSTYYTATSPNQYPTAASATVINNSTDPLTVALKPNFIKEVPLDPLNAGNNVYKYQSQNQITIGGVTVYRDFTLYATLENRNNRKGWVSGAWAVDGYRLRND
jgi:prepilin-type N-terminal cleavage/methylation domain-containing protein